MNEVLLDTKATMCCNSVRLRDSSPVLCDPSWIPNGQFMGATTPKTNSSASSSPASIIFLVPHDLIVQVLFSSLRCTCLLGGNAAQPVRFFGTDGSELA
jgi:hypothetical protein